MTTSASSPWDVSVTGKLKCPLFSLQMQILELVTLVLNLFKLVRPLCCCGVCWARGSITRILSTLSAQQLRQLSWLYLKLTLSILTTILANNRFMLMNRYLQLISFISSFLYISVFSGEANFPSDLCQDANTSSQVPGTGSPKWALLKKS